MKRLILILLIGLFAVTAQAATCNLPGAVAGVNYNFVVHWDKVTPLPGGADISRYQLLCDNTPGVDDLTPLDVVKTTSAGNNGLTVLANIGVWYCALETIDAAGHSSEFSDELSYTCPDSDTPLPPPDMPILPPAPGNVSGVLKQ